MAPSGICTVEGTAAGRPGRWRKRGKVAPIVTHGAGEQPPGGLGRMETPSAGRSRTGRCSAVSEPIIGSGAVPAGSAAPAPATRRGALSGGLRGQPGPTGQPGPATQPGRPPGCWHDLGQGRGRAGTYRQPRERRQGGRGAGRDGGGQRVGGPDRTPASPATRPTSGQLGCH